MRFPILALTISSLAVAACGKKAPPPPVGATPAPAPTSAPAPAPEADAAPAPAPEADAAPAPAPEADAAPAPAPEADAAPAPEDDAAPAPAPTADATQPGYWAVLFEKGKTSDWDVAEEVTTTPQNDKGEPGKPEKKSLKGKLTCTVKDVVPGDTKTKDGGKLAVSVSTVDCTGYSFDNGVQEGPQGTWLSDGKQLWKRIGEDDEARIPAEPAVKSEKDEETEIAIVAGEGTDVWCWKANILVGDGGALEACFDKAKGPVKFFGYGGSAMTDSKVTVTPAAPATP